jgi:hypothetical protein
MFKHIISTDEDPGIVRIESFAVINLRGVSTNKTSNQYITIYTLYNEANSVSMSQN